MKNVKILKKKVFVRTLCVIAWLNIFIGSFPSNEHFIFLHSLLNSRKKERAHASHIGASYFITMSSLAQSEVLNCYFNALRMCQQRKISSKNKSSQGSSSRRAAPIIAFRNNLYFSFMLEAEWKNFHCILLALLAMKAIKEGKFIVFPLNSCAAFTLLSGLSKSHFENPTDISFSAARTNCRLKLKVHYWK